MLYLLVSQFDNLSNVFPEWRIWKICMLGKLNRPLHKTKGKITASVKSEIGEGLLYQQLLSTLKRDIPGFQQTCPSNKKITLGDFWKPPLGVSDASL